MQFYTTLYNFLSFSSVQKALLAIKSRYITYYTALNYSFLVLSILFE